MSEDDTPIRERVCQCDDCPEPPDNIDHLLTDVDDPRTIKVGDVAHFGWGRTTIQGTVTDIEQDAERTTVTVEDASDGRDVDFNFDRVNGRTSLNVRR